VFDWKVFIATFSTIFIAELGDKTQFAALAASSQAVRIREVFLGVVLALALAGALGVLAGRVLAQFISPQIMRWVSGSLFIAMGAWILYNRGEG
jgi:putative Ca2+/H+ antiporter (TMEM165/GDT1 family)